MVNSSVISCKLMRETINSQPIVSQFLHGQLGIHFERYLCQPMKFTLPPMPDIILATQFGGTKVTGEAETSEFNADFFTGFSVLIPSHSTTTWHFEGVTDIALFYLPLSSSYQNCQLIEKKIRLANTPIPVTEPLASLAIRQVAQELFGKDINDYFVGQLVEIILEKVARRLSGPIAAFFKIVVTISYIFMLLFLAPS